MPTKSLEQIFGTTQQKSLDSIFGTQQKEKTGFISGVKEDLSKRGGQFADTFKQTASGDINPLQTGIRTVGSSIGAIGDVLGRGIIEGGKALLPKVAEDKIAEGLEKVFNSKPVKSVVNTYEDFKQKHPEAAKDLEAVGNIASIFPIKKAVGIGAKATKTISKPIINGTGKVTDTVGTGTKFFTSQVSGLSPDTIKTILKDPSALSVAEKEGLERASLASAFKGKLDSRIADLKSTGTGYNAIRGLDEVVEIKNNPIKTVLDKFKVGLENGKLVRTRKTTLALKEGDIKAVEDFVNLFGNETKLTADEFLNARSNLSEMAKFGVDKSDAAKQIARELRKEYDKLGKDQITGLKSLDKEYSTEKTALAKIKKDFLDKDGNLKDNAINKIANATGKGKDQLIMRMEELSPGISEKINIVKALEDIEYAKGQKVGAYARGAIVGGGTAFIATGMNPIAGLIGLILSHPSVVVNLLKWFGVASNINKGIIDNIISKLKSGQKLVKEEKEIIEKALAGYSDKFLNKIKDKTKDIQPGLSIKDVSKADDLSTVTNKLDNANVDNMIQEAKKYKSAEEFVNSQTIVYHGSQSPLKKFDDYGAWFTDDMMNAEGYGAGENVYEGFLNLKNPLVIDAKGRHHSDLITKYGTDTQEVVSNVDSKKYDGVIFKNINDSFADDVDGYGTDTIYYPFNANKSFINEDELIDIWNKANKK